MRLLNDALIIGKKAVVADLHFGLVPYYDAELLEKVLKLAERFQSLIVLGDFKHIGKSCPNYIEEISQITELLLIKGNHDLGLNCPKSIKIGKSILFHGHAKVEMGAKNLIFAHAHPSVFIPSEVGGFKERAFLFGEVEIGGETKNIFVLPSFNELCSSTAVNLERPAGFMFRKFDYRKWKAILLDGTFLSLQVLNNP